MFSNRSNAKLWYNVFFYYYFPIQYIGIGNSSNLCDQGCVNYGGKIQNQISSLGLEESGAHHKKNPTQFGLWPSSVYSLGHKAAVSKGNLEQKVQVVKFNIGEGFDILDSKY